MFATPVENTGSAEFLNASFCWTYISYEMHYLLLFLLLHILAFQTTSHKHGKLVFFESLLFV